MEFNPDDSTVVEWLELAMEEKDPAVPFLPEGVHPLCKDPDRETVLRLHPAVDERGLARLPGAQRRRPSRGGRGGTGAEPGRA